MTAAKVTHHTGSAITTHVLDTTSGRAAAGVGVTLERRAQNGDWSLLDETATDRDGRARFSAREAEGRVLAGAYRLTFYAGDYHQRQGVRGFYPEVVVVFEVRDAAEHYHVPLLLSPHGYSTYRGT